MLLWTLLAAALLAFTPNLAATTGAYATRSLITCNDDFNSRATNIAELIAAGFDALFIQEGKAEDYRTLRGPDGKLLLPRASYGIHQDTSSSARAGSVVIWRWDAFPDHQGAGFTFGVAARGLLARWIAWVRLGVLEAPRGRARLLLFAAHEPPRRARRWWHPFEVALWARLRLAKAAGRIVLGGMDSNRHSGPRGVPRGLRWVPGAPGSIDGFVLSERVHVVGRPEELPKGSSDHHPYRVVVLVPLRHARRRRHTGPAAA